MAERYKYFFKPAIILLAVLLPHCDKEFQDPVPNVHVSINLDLSSTLYGDLSIIGNHIYITGGYRGIIVYRMSQDDFRAYERACPYDHHKQHARVVVEDNGLTMIDSTCLSRYLLLDGSVFEGPATRGLKTYRTHYTGNNLYISN